MENNNKFPIRKGYRLENYDYSKPNYYYVTICTKQMKWLMWECRGEHYSSASKIYKLSNIGKVVKTAIENISKIYDEIVVDKYTIMPNHIHMIIVIKADEFGRAMLAPTISTIIAQMKGYVTKQIGLSIWQKLFYDEIIRSQKGYERVWQYIDENHLKWREDDYCK